MAREGVREECGRERGTEYDAVGVDVGCVQCPVDFFICSSCAVVVAVITVAVQIS